MKKSVLFLINGLGIEKPGSYSIAIDQIMPQLCRIKETSYFTTAITSSLEYKGAYQRFFLGDTYKAELEYIDQNILNSNIVQNPVYQGFESVAKKPEAKLHVFVEPTNDKVVEQINKLVTMLGFDKNKKVYLHLILTQQTVSDYNKLISIINYIKFHLNSCITVGFVMGKEYLPEELTKNEMDYLKKLLFYCSCERWTETEKKLQNLQETNVIPCKVQGFCATNECFLSNGDTILFFNTRRNNYDNLIKGIYEIAPEVFKTTVDLPAFSLIQLYTQYNIPFFKDNIEYEYSLSTALAKHNKKALIITDDQNISLVNFYANGLNSVNNPLINFMRKDDNLYNKEYIEKLIDQTDYDLFIFDYHMDVSQNINHLKEQLSKIDIVIGNLGEVCVNKHSLFITSLYGLKKELPVADYNDEMVLIDYEMQIPIFFFDYNYPKGKYYLAPGETNDILTSALRCIIEDDSLYSLVKEKGILNNLIKNFMKQ